MKPGLDCFNPHWALVLCFAATIALTGLLPDPSNAEPLQATNRERSEFPITVRKCDRNFRNCTNRITTYPKLSTNIKRDVDKALATLPKHDSGTSACQWVGGGNKWVLVCSLIDKEGSCGCVFWDGGSACKGDHPGCPTSAGK